MRADYCPGLARRQHKAAPQPSPVRPVDPITATAGLSLWLILVALIVIQHIANQGNCKTVYATAL